jgi:hypothetical protein
VYDHVSHLKTTHEVWLCAILMRALLSLSPLIKILIIGSTKLFSETW